MVAVSIVSIDGSVRIGPVELDLTDRCLKLRLLLSSSCSSSFFKLISPSGQPLRDDMTLLEAGLDVNSYLTLVTCGRLPVYSTAEAFAAVKIDGSVVTWGKQNFGGNSEAAREQLASDAQHISSTKVAFAALKNDGSVVTWGDKNFGGNSEAVWVQLAADVQHIYSAEAAFAAVKRDGSVVTWGDQRSGGNSEAVREQLAADV